MANKHIAGGDPNLTAADPPPAQSGDQIHAVREVSEGVFASRAVALGGAAGKEATGFDAMAVVDETTYAGLTPPDADTIYFVIEDPP